MTELSQSNLLLAPYPTTIVDLSAHTVRQVCSFQTFNKLRQTKSEPLPHIPVKVAEAEHGKAYANSLTLSGFHHKAEPNRSPPPFPENPSSTRSLFRLPL